jgi:hypothetical protein
MPKLTRLGLCVAIAACCGLSITAFGKPEEWKNGKGETFTATPSDLIGPWAVFDDGTLVPLGLMSDADCVRFYQSVKNLPARASNWKDAKGAVSAETYGRLQHYSGSELAPDVEDGKPEPEFFIIFFTTIDHNQSWNELQRSAPELYSKMIHEYPGRVVGIVFGVGEQVQDQFDISNNTHGEWLFTVFDSEVLMRTLTHRIPTNNYGVVVMTRNGVPLAGPDATAEEQEKAIFKTLDDILSHSKPTDPRVWVQQRHYWAAVQPVAFANGVSPPLLMGNPLNEEILRKMKIYKVDAKFHIAADGRVVSVDVVPYDMPPKTVKMFTDGFQKGTLFVPAVDHGKFVDGVYDYHIEVAP